MQYQAFLRKTAVLLVILTLIIITTALLVHSPDDIPIIDDWTYAWSVEHFQQTGELRVLDFSSNYPFAQILWGGAFTKLFGFSFSILRISTVVWGGLGLLAFFITLRTMSIEPFPSALATVALLFNPVFFVLWHSFMTDVPFVSTMNIAVLCYVLWMKRRSALWLCLGGIAATVAFLIRQIGAVFLVLPLSYLLLCRIAGERRTLSWPQGIYLLVPFLGVSFVLWWIQHVHGATNMSLMKAGSFLSLLHVSWWFSSYAWWTYFMGLIHALTTLGILLCPLALASLWGKSKGVLLLASAIVGVVMGLYLWHAGEFPKILHYGDTLSVEELGASRTLISPWGGDLSRPIPAWATYALLSASLLSSIGLVAALIAQLRSWTLWPNKLGTILSVNSLLQFLLIETLWLYYDRYYLPLLPGLITLLMIGMRRTTSTQVVLIAGTLLCGAIAISGTIDHFRFNGAVSQARTWLLHQHVAPSQIDAGYVLNGWWLYAHPENLSPGARPESDVTFVTTEINLPFKVANSPVPSYKIIRAFTWQSLWAVSDTIYVLQRTDMSAQ
jgi:hypothetical protein